MKNIFADADYWIALLNPHDQLHSKASSVSSKVQRLRIITTEMILVEVLNGLASKGPTLRSTAANFVEQIRSNANVSILPQTSIQFQNALKFYKTREDKDWSLTDCASILAMQDGKITEILSYDKHFAQAGFMPLLRE
jgi:uncharacterized protein